MGFELQCHGDWTFSKTLLLQIVDEQARVLLITEENNLSLFWLPLELCDAFVLDKHALSGGTEELHFFEVNCLSEFEDASCPYCASVLLTCILSSSEDQHLVVDHQ